MTKSSKRSSHVTIRIGVTGSGFMGRTHVDAANRIEETEIVAVSGGSRAAKLASDYRIDHEADARSLIGRNDIDAIVISTPHYVHIDEAMMAAEAGKHVLVEKPMATTNDDCRTMISAFAERGLVLSVGYHQRFRESNHTTCQLIREGAIGRVLGIQTTALFDIETMRRDSGFGGDWGWWRDPRSVAHLINSAPHTIDLCRWWLQDEFETAAAQSRTFREDNPNENTTMALLTMAGGASVSFWSSSVLPDPGFPGEAFRFRIMGEGGLIDLDPYGKLQLANDGEWKTVFEQPPVGHDDSNVAFGSQRMQAYSDQMAHFARTIRGESGEQGSAQDGFAGVASVMAMLESSKTGRIVAIEPS